MAINFPNSPIVGQTYTFNEKTWQWSGSYWEVFSAQTGYVTSAFNVGGANEIFKEKSGNSLYFRTLSGGSNTTISTVGDVVKVDVTIPADTNTFVTGFTYNNANTFTIGQNDGSNFSASINTVTGLTVSGNLLVTDNTTLSGLTTVYGDTPTSAAIRPGLNNTYDLGQPSFRWREIYTTNLDATNVITTFSLFATNNITADNNLVVSGSSRLIGSSTYESTVNGTDPKEIVNVEYLTAYTESNDTYVTGGTVSVSATDSDNSGTIGLFYKNSDGIPRTLPFEDTFTTGATYDNLTALATFKKNDGTSYNLDLSSIDVNDTFVTGSTVTSNVLELTRNDSQQVLQLSGGTNIQFIDNGNNSITLNAASGGGGGAAVSFPWKFKVPTASADPGSGQFRLNNTIPSGITEIYVSNETNNGIDASNFLNIIDVGDVIYIQQNDDANRALLFTVSASTVDNTGWFTIPVQYQQGSQIPKKDKICGWIFASTGAEDNTVSNVGVGQGVFKQRNVNDFEFYSLSGGTNTTLTLNNDTIVIDSEDIYVIAGTYVDNTDTISLLRNDGNFVNITGVTDTFTTGATYDNGTALATFNRNDGNSYTLDLSSIDVNDTFVTGFTYNNNNTFTISRNDGVDISTSINIVSGLTVNGDLTVTGETSLQSTTASTITLSSTPTENNTNTEILSRNSSTGVVEYRDIATFGVNITTVTATTYTATTTDDVIGFDTTSVSPTLFLPDSTTIGRIRYEVKDIGFNSRRNPITIQAAGSDLILTTQSTKSFDLSADGGAVILVSTGTGQWWQM